MIAYPHHPIHTTSIPTSDGQLSLALERLAAVDDLSKYNIIHYIYHHPEAYGDAAFFAKELGFHSIEQTQAALGALRAAGILSCWGHVYGKPSNIETWHAIASVCSLDPASSEYRLLLHRLAVRSAHLTQAK